MSKENRIPETDLFDLAKSTTYRYDELTHLYRRCLEIRTSETDVLHWVDMFTEVATMFGLSLAETFKIITGERLYL